MIKRFLVFQKKHCMYSLHNKKIIFLFFLRNFTSAIVLFKGLRRFLEINKRFIEIVKTKPV